MPGKDCQKAVEAEIKKGLTKHQALNAAAGAGSVGKGKRKKKRGKTPK